jgi:FkbM family methyltransferase
MAVVTELNFADLRLNFHTPNAACRWRVETLLTKEPVTIEWIQTFTKADVFVDVGANVGMYSILAAKLSGCRVYAFEPEAENFVILNRNIRLNDLEHLITAYPVALSYGSWLGELHLSGAYSGGSCHSIDRAHDYKGEAFKPFASQGCVVMGLTTALNGKPNMTRLKVDVDGLEHDVIRGASWRLESLHSLLLEVNPALPAHRGMVEELLKNGFRCDFEQVMRSMRADGPFAGVAEYLFYR